MGLIDELKDIVTLSKEAGISLSESINLYKMYQKDSSEDKKPAAKEKQEAGSKLIGILSEPIKSKIRLTKQIPDGSLQGKCDRDFITLTAGVETYDEARKIFRLPDCNRSFDTKSKPCLNYHIGLCEAPCKGGISH